MPTDAELIELANTETSIMDVCRMVGIDLPDIQSLVSAKTWCPFGDVSHADGGDAKAFRIYPDTNDAYCFACSVVYKPVSLIALQQDISPLEAAEFLLLEANYVAPDVDSQIAELLAAGERVSVSQTDLAETLKVFCSGICPDWEERQFEPTVAEKLGLCLSLLGKVSSPADAKKWLHATKLAMTSILGDPS